MRFTFNKGEKLNNRKLVQCVFSEGKNFVSYPILVAYLQIEHDSEYPIQAAFSVPKKHFKKAVDRNRIKRQMREAYRLYKHELYKKHTKKHIFMFIYIAKDFLSYREISEAIEKIFRDIEL